MRKRKKTRKLKHKLAEEDWGLEGGESKELEEMGVAKTNFLKSDLSWATLRGPQTMIWILSPLEIKVRRLVIRAGHTQVK